MGKKFKVKVNGEFFDVEIEEVGSAKTIVEKEELTSQHVERTSITNQPANKSATAEHKENKPAESPKSSASKGNKVVVAPLPGKVLSVKVKEGDTVKRGDLLLILEAMKMENEIFASQDGKVTEVLVSPGDYVSTGDKLVVME